MADYCTTAEVKAWVNITDSTDDTKIALAISSASRWIDTYCNRRFWLDPTPVARTFVPQDLTLLTYIDDIGDPSVSIKTDPAGDGTFEITWQTSDFELLPVSAPTAYPEPKPWTGIRAVGTLTFPWLVNTWLTRYDRIQITAKWGWPQVPDAVHQAAIIQAARLFARRSSIDGIAGGVDFALRVSNKLDPDVASLLTDYRRNAVLVA